MKTLFLFACLFISIHMGAQAPQSFHYQGIARTSEGTPIADQDVTVRITLRQGTAIGTQVYREVHSTETNKLGIFNLEIGRGSQPSGTFSNISWGTNAHYVQVEIDPAGGSNYVDIGTAQLLSVPYALYAANSGGNSQWTTGGNNIYYNAGNVGIGTTSPGHKLSIEGVDVNGPERQYIDLNNRSLSNRSNVYIGLTAGNPENYTYLSHNSESYDVENFDFADYGTLDSRGAGLILVTANENGKIRFMTNHDPSTNVAYERMRITSDGHVGIGTTDPGSKLQITDGDVFIENISSGVIMKSPNGQCWRVQVQNDGTMKTTSIACPN